MKIATLLLALALPVVGSQDPLRCAPAKDLVLRKVFEREGHLKLAAFDMTVDGVSHRDMPKPELEVDLHEKSVFLDRCAEVEDERVTKLVRTYEHLSKERVQRIGGSEGTKEETANSHSDLEGAMVVFTWEAQDEVYGAAFEDGEGDSKLLEGLEAEIDLCAFLPPGAVQEGASWDVPAKAFGALICPGGNLKLVSDQGEAQGGEVEFARSLQGTIRATLLKANDDGLARINLELEVDASTQRDLEDGSGTERQSNDYKLSGELAWRTAGGHFHSIELTGSLRSAILTARDLEMDGREFHTDRTLELAGEVTYSLRALAP